VISNKLRLDLAVASAKPAATAEEKMRVNRAYSSPELHDAGKAGDLVQGGGGNVADNNRSRQY
jgi:hypothetical protein